MRALLRQFTPNFTPESAQSYQFTLCPRRSPLHKFFYVTYPCYIQYLCVQGVLNKQLWNGKYNLNTSFRIVLNIVFTFKFEEIKVPFYIFVWETFYVAHHNIVYQPVSFNKKKFKLKALMINWLRISTMFPLSINYNINSSYSYCGLNLALQLTKQKDKARLLSPSIATA